MIYQYIRAYQYIFFKDILRPLFPFMRACAIRIKYINYLNMLIVVIRANVGLEDFERRLSRARSTATPTIPTNSPSCRVCCTSALGHRSTTLDLLPVPLALFLLPLNNTRDDFLFVYWSRPLHSLTSHHWHMFPVPYSDLIELNRSRFSLVTSYSSPLVLRVLGAQTSTCACFFVDTVHVRS